MRSQLLFSFTTRAAASSLKELLDWSRLKPTGARQQLPVTPPRRNALRPTARPTKGARTGTFGQISRARRWAAAAAAAKAQSACLRKNAGISISSMPLLDRASTLAAAWVRALRQTLGVDRPL